MTVTLSALAVATLAVILPFVIPFCQGMVKGIAFRLFAKGKDE